jgi:ATP-dependent Zn protease
VFIDEIGLPSTAPGAGLGGATTSESRRCNQLLVEMDGFDQTGRP